jgi:hypothetical protein
MQPLLLRIYTGYLRHEHINILIAIEYITNQRSRYIRPPNSAQMTCTSNFWKNSSASPYVAGYPR